MSPGAETQARFLGAIADQVPAERVAEVHLFQPIRQGGQESCVAVVAVSEATENTHERLAVYTAKYRLTLKGPDRGKWEFAMNAEADAPLVTVDAVVQGVKRRSGDVDDPGKLSGDEFREQLPRSEPAPPS
jgi:hypothetical protein